MTLYAISENMLLKRMELRFSPIQENLRQHASDMGRTQTKGRFQQRWPGNTQLICLLLSNKKCRFQQSNSRKNNNNIGKRCDSILTQWLVTKIKRRFSKCLYTHLKIFSFANNSRTLLILIVILCIFCTFKFQVNFKVCNFFIFVDYKVVKVFI